MGGELDFSKSQIPTISPITPGRGKVGNNIDRCMRQMKFQDIQSLVSVILFLMLYFMLDGLILFRKGDFRGVRCL